MSFEECVRKGIGIAYVSEGYSPFQNVICGTGVNFHHEGGNMIDEGIKHNTILNSGCSTLLLRNLDFDDLYSASLKEEEEEVEENKPALSHLEEIAEMNERLRAKLIREMNMSDRSLMNDSPICIDVETPIPEVQQSVSQLQISDQTGKQNKSSSKPTKPTVTRRQAIKKESEPSINRDESSEDDWADSKPVSVVQNQQSKEDDWDDAKPVIVQPATKNSNSNSKDDSDWEDGKKVKIEVPLSIQSKSTSRRRRKATVQSKPTVQPEWSDDEWESVKVNNNTSPSIKKETSRKKKSSPKSINTKDDWSDDDWEDSQALTMQKEEKQKEIKVKSSPQKEEDWEDSKPVVVSTKTNDTKPVSHLIKADDWTDDEEEWEDSTPVVIAAKTVDSKPVSTVTIDDDWEDSKPVAITPKKDDVQSVTNTIKSDDWTDDEEDWEDSKPVDVSLKKADTKTNSNSTIVSNEEDEKKRVDIKPYSVTLKADKWSDEGDIWEDSKPVSVAVVKDEQSESVPTPIKTDNWSDEGDIWEDSKPIASSSKKTDEWSDEGDIWGDSHSSSNKKEEDWETIVSPMANEEPHETTAEQMDWSDDEVKVKTNPTPASMKQDDMWADSKPVKQETTSTSVQTIKPSSTNKSRRTRRRRGSLTIKMPDDSDEEREKSQQVVIKREVNTKQDDWSDEEEWKSSKPVVNTNQKRVDDFIGSIPDFSFLGLSNIK